MAHLVLCEPTELYNILNQVTKLSRLTEPNYLCLLDVRSKKEYDESHVITALRVKKVHWQSQNLGPLATLQQWGKNGRFHPRSRRWRLLGHLAAEAGTLPPHPVHPPRGPPTLLTHSLRCPTLQHGQLLHEANIDLTH
ncbi:serine/threonine/tyrosine interacting like 1 [Rhinolophus ferrumequinum]|uniref:Serine/threonine/tyrosine interacting like 1 n=1 Tax=Rhinolophus ferrumequinum TaxID=59479 RepID=A0A7J7Y6N5_RHIFE|nr:serine/threonine/tyrosine interacting like 1 [Rhinolophus ferrumequinum]